MMYAYGRLRPPLTGQRAGAYLLHLLWSETSISGSWGSSFIGEMFGREGGGLLTAFSVC